MCPDLLENSFCTVLFFVSGITHEMLWGGWRSDHVANYHCGSSNDPIYVVLKVGYATRVPYSCITHKPHWQHSSKTSRVLYKVVKPISVHQCCIHLIMTSQPAFCFDPVSNEDDTSSDTSVCVLHKIWAAVLQCVLLKSTNTTPEEAFNTLLWSVTIWIDAQLF